MTLESDSELAVEISFASFDAFSLCRSAKSRWEMVAFLTSNLKNSQEISYLSTIAANETVEEAADAIYDVSPDVFT